MIIYLVISVIFAFWVVYPDKEYEDDISFLETIGLFIIVVLLWPYFLIDLIIQLFKQ